MNQDIKWVEFSYKGYSSIAIYLEDQWGGEFNYPVRRFTHAFFGNTKAEAEKEFTAGVEYYLSRITQIPGQRPEQQGMAGVIEMIELERMTAEFELNLLLWPELPLQTKLEVMSLIRTTRRPIAYNQAALDELGLLALIWTSRDELSKWAQKTWTQGELERTPKGLSISKKRLEECEA